MMMVMMLKTMMVDDCVDSKLSTMSVQTKDNLTDDELKSNENFLG